MPNRALITGASRGLGLALARALAADGWELVVDARGEDDLRAAAADLGPAAAVHAVPGDVADEAHRLDLAAAVEPYEGWGGYGSSKAALEQWTRVLAAERPDLRVYVVDPGDMRTQMHQDAFPGEDISDRPLPDASVPGLLTVIEGDLPSGRYEARTVVPAELTTGVAP